MTTPDPVQDSIRDEQPQRELSDAVAPQDLPAVAEHACYVFFAVRAPQAAFPTQMDLTLAQLAKADAWLPADARDTITGERGGKPVWEPAPFPVGTDLHPHVRRLLGGDANDAPPGHACAFRLTEPARRLLEGRLLSYPKETARDERQPKPLEMRLGNRACQRIGTRLGGLPDCQLRLAINTVRLVFFRTGHGLLVAEAAFHRSDKQPLHPCWIVEGVSSLGRMNTLGWRQGAGQSKGFSLADIVQSFMGGEGESRAERRTYTATYLKFEQAPETKAARRLAVQLARHYSDDYRVVAEPQGVGIVADFDNVLHAFALEGCATLVDLTPPDGLPPSEFLTHFKTGTYEPHYLPIVVLAYHEFTTLL
nr:hypothetical protein [Pseudomonadota bacterium]